MDCIEVACVQVTHHSRSGSSSNGTSGEPYSDMGVCNKSPSFDKRQQSEAENSTADLTAPLARSERDFSKPHTGPAPLTDRGLTSPTMSSSRVLRKRKHQQGTDNTDKNEDCAALKRTREDHTVDKRNPKDPQPDVPPTLGQSPMTVRSDIGVTTRSRTATSTKKNKHSATDQSLRPDASQADVVVEEDQSWPDLDALRSRIEELEEERNDYHNSLHKETEKAMERGRQLLLLRARTATTKERKDGVTTRQQPSVHYKDESADKIIGPAEVPQRHETPTEQQIPSDKTEVLEEMSMSFRSLLERELQKQVEDLSTRLSQAELEIADRVTQVLKLFKYKWQDEQFAVQSRAMRKDDCKLAQANKEPPSGPGKAMALLERGPSDGLEPQRMSLDSSKVRLLHGTNHRLTEKLRKCCTAGAKLQTEIRELRASLEATVRSRDDIATRLKDASQSHQSEKVALEDRLRSLESNLTQACLNIEQLNKEKTSMTPLQILDESSEILTRLQSSHDLRQRILVEELKSLRSKNGHLEAENNSLAENLFELEERLQTLDLNFSESQLQLRTADSKIRLLQTTVQNLESGVRDTATKHAEDVNTLEVRITELSESLKQATAEVAKLDEELITLRAASLDKERALQKVQEDHKSTAETLAAKIGEASKADGEIARLRHFEHAVTEHDRAVKRLEQGREEMFRQQQERLAALTEARKQIILQRDQNRELQRRNEALQQRVRELDTAKREDDARFTQFLRSVETQMGRQIEEPGGELGPMPEIRQPDDATLKQLEDCLQNKLDMIEHELKWYRDDRATIYNEYRRLEQWRNEMASNVAARLSMITGSRQSGG